MADRAGNLVPPFVVRPPKLAVCFRSERKWAGQHTRLRVPIVVRPPEGATEVGTEEHSHLGILDFRARAGSGGRPAGRVANSAHGGLPDA